MKQFIKKKFLPYFFCLIFLCLSLSSCGISSNSLPSSDIPQEQRSFDAYTNELFVKEMQENTINLHYTLTDPESFGIKSHKISLGSLSKDSSKTSTASIENISAVLSNFDYNLLNTKQQLTYDILKDYCDKQLTSTSLYYYNEPLRPTTGTQSELPILLAEYAFYDSCDVTDYLALLTCVPDYFHQIALFEQEKANEGLFMPSYAAKTVIESCQSFTKNPKTNYLIDTFNTRIDSLKDLEEEKKEFYKDRNQSLVINSVIPAYEKLRDTLLELQDRGKNENGLCYLPEGKQYYEFLVRSNTGSQKSIEELKQMTENQRNLDMTSLHEILAANPNLLEFDEAKTISEEPEAILNQLLSAMQKDFYPAADTSFEINYIHESLEHTLAPAFYLTAPIDNISHNIIYLNKSSQYSGIQLFTTLAHEGYPGHLYQTTGSYQAGLEPIRAILNYPGYVEGWATYVEMFSYQYAGLDETLARMLMLNQSALLSLYASIDMGIHYDGWNLTDTTVFLNSFQIKDEEVIRSIFELIVEEPAHYLKYYIGYLEFLELRNYAKQEFGKDYSNRAFHQAIIRIGPAPFPIVKKYLKNFYSITNS